MMLTGLGPSEALALGWEHLDLEAGTLRVARTLDCKALQLIEDTKRPSRKRVVPLVTDLRGVLRERWMAAGQPEAGLVFATTKGKLRWNLLIGMLVSQVLELVGDHCSWLWAFGRRRLSPT